MKSKRSHVRCVARIKGVVDDLDSNLERLNASSASASRNVVIAGKAEIRVSRL